MLPILESLAQMEETVVRDEAVKSLEKVANKLDASALLNQAGFGFERTDRSLAVPLRDAPIELLFVRAKDVGELVADGVAPVGNEGKGGVRVEVGVGVTVGPGLAPGLGPGEGDKLGVGVGVGVGAGGAGLVK